MSKSERIPIIHCSPSIIFLLYLGFYTLFFLFCSYTKVYSVVVGLGSFDATASNNGRRIVRDSLGVIHVVYGYNGVIYYSNSTNNGVSWSSPVNISNTSESSSYPSIAVDSYNNLHVVWEEAYPYGPEGLVNPEIYYSKYTTSWSPSINISNNFANSESPSIAIDLDNYLHVTWHENYNTSSRGIYYSKYTTSWSPPINISNTGGYSYNSSIIIDLHNYVHVVWHDTSSGATEIYYSKYTTSWSIPVNISNNFGYSRVPSIAVDSDNYLYVVWEDDTSGNLEIYYSEYSTSWSAPKNISNTLTSSSFPNLAYKVSSSGIDLVWTEGNTFPKNVMYQSFTVVPPPDTIPPSPITNLQAINPTINSITLTWTATGDDGNVGTATTLMI